MVVMCPFQIISYGGLGAGAGCRISESLALFRNELPVIAFGVERELQHSKRIAIADLTVSTNFAVAYAPARSSQLAMSPAPTNTGPDAGAVAAATPVED